VAAAAGFAEGVAEESAQAPALKVRLAKSEMSSFFMGLLSSCERTMKVFRLVGTLFQGQGVACLRKIPARSAETYPPLFFWRCQSPIRVRLRRKLTWLGKLMASFENFRNFIHSKSIGYYVFHKNLSLNFSH
jgi:hypothetical protein